jgi:hypothetical protein
MVPCKSDLNINGNQMNSNELRTRLFGALNEYREITHHEFV